MEASHSVGGKDLRRFQVLVYEEFLEQNRDELSAICAEEGIDSDIDIARWCKNLFEDAHGERSGRGYAQLVWTKPTVTQETYTFSRALHLMRYSGKKMRCVDPIWEVCYCLIENGEFVIRWDEELLVGRQCLDPDEIMGSWVEVKS